MRRLTACATPKTLAALKCVGHTFCIGFASPIRRIKMKKRLPFFLCALCVLCGGLQAGETPVKPFKVWTNVKSPELKELHAPVAERFELPNGMTVFLLED